MSLSDLANFGEFISSIAVLAIPTYRVVWQGVRPSVSPKTASLVEGFIATTPLANPQTAAIIPQLLRAGVKQLAGDEPAGAHR